ncbi:hypothetical protein Micbo1qcDRAFT_235185 [Microdochium bolleyi]|uniref:NmrA-like domain-containing protein n=1 Tax=Microdochium bolleyi TaxID=196109 RepID=A0A136IWG0_9PEZI|nr:hypothetical protein Micbo1qcDRAFT_235185 [Microdochium bolleyi]
MSNIIMSNIIMSNKTVVTVIGATGTQGGSVVAALLHDPTYTIRAVTRNIDSDKARSLAAQGVQVVSADLDDTESLRRAFAGSKAIFAVTNFFEALAVTSDSDEAMRIETRQARNLADAAAATPGLEHYIWSSLPNASQNTRGQAPVSYMASKNAGDAYIREELPELWQRTTLVWFGWYAGNVRYPLYAPHKLLSFAGSPHDVVHYINVPGDTPQLVPLLGSETVNPGIWVRAILGQPQLTLPGKAVAAVAEYMSLGQVVAAQEQARAEAAAAAGCHGVAGVAGRSHIVEVSDAQYADMWPVWGAVLGSAHRYMAALPGRSFESVHGEIQVLQRGDLEMLEGLVSTKQAFDQMAAAAAAAGA